MPVTTVLTASSEVANDNVTNDWQVLDPHHVLLRAKRQGNQNGRISVITITATDQAGNKTEQQVNVIVPHDNSGNRLLVTDRRSSQTLVTEGYKRSNCYDTG